MPFWVYVLTCSDGSYYTGHTDNLEARLGQHDQGLCLHTAKRRPLTLSFSETFPTREDALARELQIKGWSRAKKEALFVGDWERIAALAKSRSCFDRLSTNGISLDKGF